MNSFKIGNIFTPDYSHLTGLLKHLNAEELTAILNDDEKANEMINDLKQVKDIEAEREMLLASNRSISEFNLSQKTVLEGTREDLNTTYKRAVELKDNLLSAKLNIETNANGQSRATLLALLQTAASEIEEEADATVDAFLKSDLTVEDFLEKYLELRKLSHLRRIKSEKLFQIIQTGGDSINTPERPQRLRKPPPPPVPNPPPQNSVPYPHHNTNVASHNFNQNIPIAPSRQAPAIPNYGAYPPFFGGHGPPPNNSSPFRYCSPYPMPQPTNFPTNKRG